MINLILGITIGVYLSAGFINMLLMMGRGGIFGASFEIHELLRAWLLWPWQRF